MKHLYSRIPKVDDIIENEKISNIINSTSKELVMETIREVLDELRKKISLEKDNIAENEFSIEFLISKIENKVDKKYDYKFKKVVNGTGTVIHTNLGRSLISKEVMNHIEEMTTSYSNLEFNLETGERGSRYSSVIDLIRRVTGAEDAIVVNNNAAAVILALSCWGEDKEVITSRGELVEIGGSFRIPEVMEQSGAKLVEVGATNKTHLSDYDDAINENTGALLKVHTSNFRIVGFTESVELEELVELGMEKNIPVIEDLGSGVLVDLSKYGLGYEPTVRDSVNAGVDIITFSGDKLLGGPQAGIIIGKTEYIDKMKKHPLNRAFRIDKFTIAALEGTLRLYLNEEEAIEHIPTLKLITQDIEEIDKRAIKFKKSLEDISDDDIENLNLQSIKTKEELKEVISKYDIEIVDEFSQVGGGSMPLERIPTRAIKVSSNSKKISHLERNMRGLETPIIGRIYKENYFIDFRTVFEEQLDYLKSGFLKSILTI